MNEQVPKAGEHYHHFKSADMRYEIVGTALHTETEELLVVYRPLYKTDYELFARPVSMFFEHIEKPEIGYSGPRFIRIAVS